MPDARASHGRADPHARHARRADVRAKDLLRDACLLEGRERHLLLPAESKFKVRYSTFGFQPEAKLDDGEMWPDAYALIKLTPKVEAQIVELVKKAVS